MIITEIKFFFNIMKKNFIKSSFLDFLIAYLDISQQKIFLFFKILCNSYAKNPLPPPISRIFEFLSNLYSLINFCAK